MGARTVSVEGWGSWRRWGGLVVAVALLIASCTTGNAETTGNAGATGNAGTGEQPVPVGWLQSEPELAPDNFNVVAEQSVDGSGGEISEEGTQVSIPVGAFDETAAVTVRQPLGAFEHEYGGAIVGIDHRGDLATPVTVRWDISELDPQARDGVLLVRWDDSEQRWVPGDIDPIIEGDTLTADVGDWSFWSWIANLGQSGGEIIGRRAAAPECEGDGLHDWVGGVVDPDEGTSAAAMRVCYENDRDEIVTMRVVNNRTFGQVLHVDGSDGWEWVWTGEDELSAVQAVRIGAATVFNDERRIFIPPLHEVAVGIARPGTGGSHIVEFRNQSNVETFIADAVMFGMSKLTIPGPGVERVGVLVEATIECALAEVAATALDPDIRSIASAATGAITACAALIADPNSDVGLAFRAKLSQRIAAFPNAEAAADAMAKDRLLRSASRVLRLLVVAEVVGYLSDVGAESLVGDLRWSIRGSGRNAPLGEWTPRCDDAAADSNLIYRNLALQDEFSDTSVELHDFPRWPEAAHQAVAPLAACAPDYLAQLVTQVRHDWGDAQAANEVAEAIETLASPQQDAGSVESCPDYVITPNSEHALFELEVSGMSCSELAALLDDDDLDGFTCEVAGEGDDSMSWQTYRCTRGTTWFTYLSVG
jgi:hypothetical protein